MLTTTQIDDIIRRIVNRFQPEKVVLFGSYAKGIANENSDLDIAVIKHTNDDEPDDTYSIRNLFRGKAYIIPMDIVLMTSEELNRRRNEKYTLEYNIINEGKVVYER